MVKNIFLLLGVLLIMGVLGANGAPAAEPLAPPASSFPTGAVTVVGSTTVGAGSFALKSVDCPAGMVATGGGVDPYNVWLMQVTSSGPIFAGGNRLLGQPDGANPAPVGWLGGARNESTESRTLKVAVICAPLADVTTVVTSATAGAGSFALRSVGCPDGMVVTGGGIDLYNVWLMQVTSSGPTFPGGTRLLSQPDGAGPAPVGWLGGGRNETAESRLIKVAAICAPLSNLSTTISSAMASTGSFALKSATCPDGMVAVGGGVDLYNVWLMEVTSSGPTFPPDGVRLLSQPDGANPAPVGWLAGGRNDTGSSAPVKVATICAQPPRFLPFVTR